MLQGLNIFASGERFGPGEGALLGCAIVLGDALPPGLNEKKNGDHLRGQGYIYVDFLAPVATIPPHQDYIFDRPRFTLRSTWIF